MALATVTLRTSLLPPLSFSTDDLGGEGGAPGAGAGEPSLLLRLLQPAWTVETPVGTWSKAPAGEPGAVYWASLPAVVLLVVAVLGFAVYGVVRALGRR